jgi:hypothetical protein
MVKNLEGGGSGLPSIQPITPPKFDLRTSLIQAQCVSALFFVAMQLEINAAQ